MREEEKIWQTRAQMDKCQNITDQMVRAAPGAGRLALARVAEFGGAITLANHSWI